MKWTRRQFLRGAAGAAAACAIPRWAWASTGAPVRALSFYHLHTGELVQDIPYWERGEYLPDALGELDRVLRDHRTGEVASIDPLLYDQLFTVRNLLGKDAAFEVICGYRSPHTNEMLASQSDGVAKNSLHIQAKAIDVRLPGVSLAALRESALALKAGGVGFYPKSNFVHLDTGRPRRW